MLIKKPKLLRCCHHACPSPEGARGWWGSPQGSQRSCGQSPVPQLPALVLCSENWYGASHPDSFSIAAFLTAPHLVKKAVCFPLEIQSYCKEKHRCNSSKHCSSITSNCNIWDYCYKVLKDLLFKRKRAKNPKEPFSPKASTSHRPVGTVLFVTSVSPHSS